MRLEPASLADLLRRLEDGLCSFESAVVMQSCTAIDSIVHHIFTKKDDQTDAPDAIAVRRFLAEQPAVLRRILHLMLQLLMTGEVASAWSMARPLLGLILLHEEGFVHIKEQIIMQQVPERRAPLKGCFNDLMMGIENNLSPKNKENFTKNLYVFAQLMRSSFT